MAGTWVETFGPAGPGQPGAELAAEADDATQWMLGGVFIVVAATGTDNGDGTITYTTDYLNEMDPGASSVALAEAATLWGDAATFTNLVITVEATIDMATGQYLGGIFYGGGDGDVGGIHYRILMNGTLNETGIIEDPPGHEGTVDYLEVSIFCDPTDPTLDIKPGSCPNPLNRRSMGKLPVAIIGTTSFDVAMIDIGSLHLSRADGIGGSVAPLEGPRGPYTTIEDVGTPFCGEVCDCHELEGDGIDDLSMKFSSSEVTETLELNDVENWSIVELVVSGALVDGTEFSVSDCVRVQGTTRVTERMRKRTGR
jgi:hypothetical protein